MLYLHLFCVVAMFISGRCLYKTFIPGNMLKNLNEFLCIYSGEGRGGGHQCMCIWKHIAFPTEQIDGC